MKRKIAAIFAADIAGYSRLVAEDEEETLRRLASYRLVTDDFIAKGGGRIFKYRWRRRARRISERGRGRTLRHRHPGKPAYPVDDALADCVKRDSNCQVIAIGRFSVGPN